MNYKTPGVYIEEQSTFPLSVGGLSTVIPAFIGMTKQSPKDIRNKPVKIRSLLEYESLFGTAPAEPLTVNVDPQSNNPIQVALSNPDNKLRQIMYYNLQLFFNNGGGECYVVSLGGENDTDAGLNDYENAIKSLATKPDITLLVLTDAAYYLPDPSDVYTTALEHCEKMQNCFVIFDAEYDFIDNDLGFREQVGNNNLQYGAAYTPYLNTTLNPVINLTETNTNNTNDKITVYGLQRTIETSQFKVTYSGIEEVAYFEVKKMADGKTTTPTFEVIVDSLTIKINSHGTTTIKQVTDAWSKESNKGDFKLYSDGSKDGETVTVTEQPKTAFNRQSHYSTSLKGGLKVFYTGSALAKPTVTVSFDKTKNDPQIKIDADNLLITCEEGTTIVNIVNTFNNGSEGDFSLSFEGSNTDTIQKGTKYLNKANYFYTSTISGLQCSYISDKEVTPMVTFNSDGSEISLSPSGSATSPTLTITIKNDTTYNQVMDKWNKQSNKGNFLITLAEGVDGDSQLVNTNGVSNGGLNAIGHPMVSKVQDPGQDLGQDLGQDPGQDPSQDPGQDPHLSQPLFLVTLDSVSLTKLKSQNTQHYNQILAAISEQAKIKDFPPSGAVAGLYNKTDAERGVWQSPANISINSVVAPSQSITAAQQQSLNEDPQTGKLINAIRPFLGKGTLIWGARTLDGNSNDWRYISVRRLISYIEASIKAGLQNYVFEANNAMTWLQVRAMIEPFLENLWQQGALVGSKADDAFFVNVGLGTTMTAQDILEGRMKISIGLAAVRPAEFIILDVTQLQQN